MKVGMSRRRFTWIALSGACGLALIVGLLLLVRVPVRAEPMAEPTAARLQVEKVADREFADAGDTLTYTIKVEKSGASATSAWLTDDLPIELTLITESLAVADLYGDPVGTLGAKDDVITWYAPSLGGDIWITFSAQISSETEVEDITNLVEVTGTGELVTSAWQTRIGGGMVYLPLIFRRWPPVPYAPTLAQISNPDEEPNYTVSWTYGYSEPGVDSYTLQEATDADFTQGLTEFSGIVGTSRSFADQDPGTYYYRVRGHNEYGPGPWSNVQSTTVEEPFSYFDDFSDPDSGWPSLVSRERWAFYEVDPDPPTPGDGSPYPTTGNGYFIARRSGGKPLAIFSPGVPVPDDDYEIEVDSRWWEGRWYATYQILFGANKSFSEYYAVRVQMNDIFNFCRFSIIKQTPGGTSVLNGSWETPSALDCSERRFDSDAPWNHWRIRRQDDSIVVHVNGKRLGSWKDSSFGANRYFGVRATLFEGFTPSKPEFDNFSVELLD